MLVSVSREDMFQKFDALNGGVPDSVQYQEYCQLYMNHPYAAELATMDPFSTSYADLAMQIYLDLRGRAGDYDPHRDENYGFGAILNIWKEIVPWSFRDTSLAAEFLMSWGQIMRCLDIEAGRDVKVLEYGTGSGQLLLMLARLGLRTHAVDINEGSLAQVKAQSDAMGLAVQTECAVFGEGFLGQKFDRIIFFEAFHHTIDFLPLLARLQERLERGGRLIFCGEPIVGEGASTVPYPWGPRLDALSIFCMRKWGWMELGFSQAFFLEALQRTGWLAEYRPSADCGRANTIVARSLFHHPVALGGHIELGRYASGWHDAEGTHRWTTGGHSLFPLSEDPRSKDLRISLLNALPVDRLVTMSVGTSETEILVPAGAERLDVVLRDCVGPVLTITSEGIRPSDFGGPDTRELGIAVREIEVTPFGKPGIG